MSLAERCSCCGMLEVRRKMHHSRRSGKTKSYCGKCWEATGYTVGRPEKPESERMRKCWVCQQLVPVDQMVARKKSGEYRQYCRKCWGTMHRPYRQHKSTMGRFCRGCGKDMVPGEWHTSTKQEYKGSWCEECWTGIPETRGRKKRGKTEQG